MQHPLLDESLPMGIINKNRVTKGQIYHMALQNYSVDKTTYSGGFRGRRNRCAPPPLKFDRLWFFSFHFFLHF